MRNVAVVVLDTLRLDAFAEAFDYLRGETLAGIRTDASVTVSPEFDPSQIGLARFTDAYSTAHWTVPAHASLFTGRYASEVGVHGRSPTLDCPETVLAESFAEAGYRTRCWTANPQLHQYDGWERGFEEFVGRANLARTRESLFDWERHIEATEPGLRRYLSAGWRCLVDDCETLASLRQGVEMARTPSWDGGARAIRKRLDATTFGDREFLFLNLMEAHTPYHPPAGEDRPVNVVVADALADAVEDPARIRAGYRAAVADLATQYRAILGRLHEEFDYVVTLSDHGELLGEHGLWNHSVGLHPELIRVPLVVSGRAVGGDGVPAGEYDHPVGLHDVPGTVLRLAGVESDACSAPNADDGTATASTADGDSTTASTADDPSTTEPRDLFDQSESRELLFESHGLLPFHESQFERHGLSRDEFERWRTPLAGFRTADGAFCYETDPESFRVVGETTVADPAARLERLRERLDRRPVEETETDVSDTVRRRLEELGYA